MRVSTQNSITQNFMAYLMIGMASLLLGCGGGGGGGGGSTNPPTTNPPVTNPPAQTLTANAGADRTVNAGEVVELKAGGAGTITGYSWSRTEGPSVTLTAVDLNAGWFTFVAPSTGTEDSITLTYRLTVTGNSTTAEDSVTFTILRVNAAPTASAGTAQTVKGTETITLQGSGTDIDGTITAYSWEQTAGDGVLINDSQSAQASFIAPSTLENITLTFRLTVTDNEGETAQSDVTITVTPEDAPEVTFHFPPPSGFYTASSIAAFGVASATDADVVSVTLDAGAGAVTAALGNDGKWRANNVPIPAGVSSFELVAEVTDSLNRKSTASSRLATSGILAGIGGWKSTTALAIDPSVNNAYVLTTGNVLGDVNLLPIDLTTGERGTVLSAWANEAQGTQLAPLSHMIYHTVNKQFYALTDSADDANSRALISIDPATGVREIVSGISRGTGDPFEYAIALAQGPDNSVFISDNNATKIFKVNTTTGNRTVIIDQQTATHNFQGMLNLAWNSLNPNHLYVVINNSSGSILRVNMNASPITSKLVSHGLTDEVGTGTSIGRDASDIVLDSLNNRAFVLGGFLDNIIEVDLSNGNRKEIAEDATGSTDRKRGMAFDADKQLLYTAGGFGSLQKISVIDVQTGNKVLLANGSRE